MKGVLDLRKRAPKPDPSSVSIINFSDVNVSADMPPSDKKDSELLNDDPAGNAFLRKASKIVFFGNGPVAAASLAFLMQHFDIEAVITKPRPAHHKGAVPVLEVMNGSSVPVFEVSSKKNLSDLIANKHFDSKIGVIVDFGIIVTNDVIDYFPLGIVNSHFSLLPQWRGADPIMFSILSGQSETGVTLMLIVEALDEGDILVQKALSIDIAETTDSLTLKLIKLSNSLLVEHLPSYIKGAITPYPQNTGITASYSRKTHKEESVIDWSLPALEIERKIRAYQPWPKARTVIAGKDVTLQKAHTKPRSPKYEVLSTKYGVPFKTMQKELVVQTGDGMLIIDELTPAGKKQMSAEAFLAGYGQNILMLITNSQTPIGNQSPDKQN